MRHPRETLILSLFKALSYCPLWLLQCLGIVLGNVLWLLPNHSKTVSRQNIARCFPHWSVQQQRQLLRRSLIETGKTAMEMALMMFAPSSRITNLVQGVDGESILQNALAEKNGVIIASPHLGMWEVIGQYCPRYAAMTILYRPPKMKSLERVMIKAREQAGATLVPVGRRGVKGLLQALSQGGIAGILPDQDPGMGAGVFAPFFGVPANSMTLLPRLAKKSSAAVIFAYAKRLPWGKGYQLQFMAADQRIYSQDSLVAVTAMNAGVEECVQKIPAQYQWSYQRFKTRPH
jgi:KDO2-lipid IV(A) lauroyltransferase